MQHKLPLIASMQGQPQAAPDVVLRQIKTEAQAINVAMKSGNYKLAYIAASLGISEAYVSRIRNGKRRVPRWFVTPFCRITGTKLLQQFRDWQAALAEIAQELREDEINERLAEQLRKVA